MSAWWLQFLFTVVGCFVGATAGSVPLWLYVRKLNRRMNDFEGVMIEQASLIVDMASGLYKLDKEMQDKTTAEPRKG